MGAVGAVGGSLEGRSFGCQSCSQGLDLLSCHGSFACLLYCTLGRCPNLLRRPEPSGSRSAASGDMVA